MFYILEEAFANWMNCSLEWNLIPSISNSASWKLDNGFCCPKIWLCSCHSCSWSQRCQDLLVVYAMFWHWSIYLVTPVCHLRICICLGIFSVAWLHLVWDRVIFIDAGFLHYTPYLHTHHLIDYFCFPVCTLHLVSTRIWQLLAWIFLQSIFPFSCKIWCPSFLWLCFIIDIHCVWQFFVDLANCNGLLFPFFFINAMDYYAAFKTYFFHFSDLIFQFALLTFQDPYFLGELCILDF